MRLGGQVFLEEKNPDSWSYALKAAGFRAATCPVDGDDSGELDDYLKAARKHDILISEVGAWSNPISRNDEVRKAAIAYCIKRLARHIGLPDLSLGAQQAAPGYDADHRASVYE